MMLAKIGTRKILKSKEYIFEPKLDGYRAICKKEQNKITLTSRNGLDITDKYKDIDFKIKKDCIIDGELIIYDEYGNPSFSMMQRKKGKATFIAFDIIEVENKNVKKLTLTERKKLLKENLQETKNVQIVPTTENGEALWEIIKSRKLEGVIAKKKESKYTDGRSSDWLKIKNELTIDCVIAGYLTKTRTIASLSLALYNEKNELEYIGQVGTGFTEAFLSELIKKFKVQKNEVKIPKNATHVAPILTCEIKYLMLTQDKKLRAPVFIRLREDKNPKECTMEQVKNAG